MAKKALIIVLVVALLTLAGCTPGVFTKKDATINDAIDAIDGVDAKYRLAGADFRKEEVGTHTIEEDQLPLILSDVEKEKEKMLARAAPTDEKMIRDAFTAREMMIRSQKYFAESRHLGQDAIVKDTIICKDAPAITKMADLLELTQRAAANATFAWDLVLQELVNRGDLPTARRIGINTIDQDNRIRWGFSPWKEMTLIIDRNRDTVAKYCA